MKLGRALAGAEARLGHGFARPELLVNYLGRLAADEDETPWSVVVTGALPAGMDPNAPVAYPLEINAVILDGADGPRLRATWSWPNGVIADEVVRGLADAWLAYLDALVAHAARPGAGGHTPSDLTLSGLSQEELDEFEAEWR